MKHRSIAVPPKWGGWGARSFVSHKSATRTLTPAVARVSIPPPCSLPVFYSPSHAFPSVVDTRRGCHCSRTRAEAGVGAVERGVAVARVPERAHQTGGTIR